MKVQEDDWKGKGVFMDSTELFSKTPPLKLFFLAAIPGAISMLASALYQTIDGVFVGQFLGNTAFAGFYIWWTRVAPKKHKP